MDSGLFASQSAEPQYSRQSQPNVLASHVESHWNGVCPCTSRLARVVAVWHVSVNLANGVGQNTALGAILACCERVLYIRANALIKSLSRWDFGNFKWFWDWDCVPMSDFESWVITPV